MRRQIGRRDAHLCLRYGDGCADGEEISPNEVQGGLRDPTNFWDFFDTPGEVNVWDKAVSTVDIFRMALRYGAAGDPAVDPLSPLRLNRPLTLAPVSVNPRRCQRSHPTEDVLAPGRSVLI